VILKRFSNPIIQSKNKIDHRWNTTNKLIWFHLKIMS